MYPDESSQSLFEMLEHVWMIYEMLGLCIDM